MDAFARHIEIWAGLAAAAALLAGVILFQAPLTPALVVAVLLYAGLYLIGVDRTENAIRKEARGLTRERMLEKIREGNKRLAVIRELGRKAGDPEVRDQILRICETGDLIFQNFGEDPDDVARSARFLLYLDRLLPLIEKYVRLSTTAAGRELLAEGGEGAEFREMLDTVEAGFNQGLKNYLAGDATEMRTFGRVLKRMMKTAEIGK